MDTTFIVANKESKDKPIGVVLAGGLSTRMGVDKSTYIYKGIPLYQHAVNALSNFCDRIYISVSINQLFSFHYGKPLIIDQEPAQGPLGGIVSAMKALQRPILCLACDMPFVTHADIENLFKSRSELATSYYREEAQKYEAMLSIWEKESFDAAIAYYKNGGRSAQIIFETFGVKKIPLLNKDSLKSINSKEDIY
jgi:molybdopterin-guanine dinucleotide biosynthesis protein A